MAKQTKKKKNVQINPVGEAHIQASFNNIIIILAVLQRPLSTM